ncbi:hypothetical protein Patl1_07973 [Pistacia atlantica]|uniref:Uncharacterized protein n=1 Tax=Pistacia atlantica TaxID=434234 RepID=A0ACC1AKX5_9ROSI|nr:hypothetical protein Patl1_07973 [Pistacia atlantica]
MARQLHFKPAPLSTSQAGLAAASLLLVCFCTVHSSTMKLWYSIHRSINSEMGMKVFIVANSKGAPVWQKNILMGGKCQLPDFSGVIIYDSEGNVVTPHKTPRPLLTWK